MSENEKYFRNASIWGADNVLDAVAAIPGYSIEPAPLIQEGRTHAIRTPSGDLIHLVSNGTDPEVVKTSRIDKQDEKEGGVAFGQDELVLLAKAAAAANKARQEADPDAEKFISVYVNASEHDIETLP